MVCYLGMLSSYLKKKKKKKAALLYNSIVRKNVLTLLRFAEGTPDVH